MNKRDLRPDVHAHLEYRKGKKRKRKNCVLSHDPYGYDVLNCLFMAQIKVSPFHSHAENFQKN